MNVTHDQILALLVLKDAELLALKAQVAQLSAACADLTAANANLTAALKAHEEATRG